MDGILSPAFLQAACAKKREEQPTVINLKALQADPIIKGGEASTQTSPALTATALAIEADDQAAITLSAVGLVIDTMGSQVELVTE